MKENLSKNFYLHEFHCRDGTKVPKQYRDALMRFVNQNLQGIRDFFDSPIIINSGYRTAEYNKSIGGAMKSYHLYDVYGSDGRFAVDMRMELYHPREIYRTTRGLMRCGRIEQGGLTLYPTFVHYDNRGYYTSWKPDNLNV